MDIFEEKSIGEIFKQARASRKISISRVEADIKVRRKFLEAIEDDDFSSLPNIVAAKGFIKLYSEYLGLDSKRLAEKLLNTVNKTEVLKKEEKTQCFLLDSSKPRTILSSKYAASLLPILVICFIFYFAFSYFKNSSESPPKTPVVIETKEEVSVSKKAPKPPEKILLSADFIDRTWISVELDGKEAFTGVVGRGQKMFWEADKKIKIKAGNGGGVKIALNERHLGPLGADGTVVEKEFTR